jgi:hypothetical protein
LHLTTARAGSTTVDTAGTGNSLSGRFDRTVWTTAESEDNQSGGNGVWAMTAAHSTQVSRSTEAWGNEITGEEHTSGTTETSTTGTETQTYLDGSGGWQHSLSGGSLELSYSDGNTLTGDYHTLDVVVTAHSRSVGAGTRNGVAYTELAGSAAQDVISQQTGNALAGWLVTTTAGRAGDSLTRTLTSAPGERTWQTGHASASRSAQTGNTIEGGYDLLQSSQETSSEQDSGGVLASAVMSVGGTVQREAGNEMTGAYQVRLHLENRLVTRDESGPGGLSIHQVDRQTVVLSGGGNIVTGDASLTRSLSDVYHLAEALPAGAGAGFLLSLDGLLTSTQVETVTGTTGEVVWTLVGHDAYQAVESGLGTAAYVLGVIGAEDVTQSEQGNLQSGAFTRTASGSGAYTRADSLNGNDAGVYNYSLAESGDGGAGMFAGRLAELPRQRCPQAAIPAWISAPRRPQAAGAGASRRPAAWTLFSRQPSRRHAGAWPRAASPSAPSSSSAARSSAGGTTAASRRAAPSSTPRWTAWRTPAASRHRTTAPPSSTPPSRPATCVAAPSSCTRSRAWSSARTVPSRARRITCARAASSSTSAMIRSACSS